MDLSDLTIVVPTKNEERNIETFLRSLPRQARLIVVDASDDNTPHIVRYARRHNTRLLLHPGRVTQARRLGAAAAQSEWVLFTDADVRFPPDFFSRLSCFDDVDAGYGPKLSSDRHAGFYRWFSRGQALLHRLGIPAASGSNMIVRRRALAHIGGFDLRLPCNEDTELMWRLRRFGYSVAFAPHLPVYATDHRRLDRGRWRKVCHSLVRCFLLYTNLLPPRWRSSDWGYWENEAQPQP